MEASKKTGVLVLASVAAAAAGVAVVVIMSKWRERNVERDHVESDLRGVQDVLTDCYRKIDEIERHLPLPTRPITNSNNNSSAPMFRAMTNGNPAFES